MRFSRQRSLPFRPDPAGLGGARVTIRSLPVGGVARGTQRAQRASVRMPIRVATVAAAAPRLLDPVLPSRASGSRVGKNLASVSFADKKIRHAVELAGSCMLIGLFVVLALFG